MAVCRSATEQRKNETDDVKNVLQSLGFNAIDSLNLGKKNEVCIFSCVANVFVLKSFLKRTNPNDAKGKIWVCLDMGIENKRERRSCYGV